MMLLYNAIAKEALLEILPKEGAKGLAGLVKHNAVLKNTMCFRKLWRNAVHFPVAGLHVFHEDGC